MWTHESNWRNLIVEFLGNYKSRWTMHNCCANNKHTRKDFNASLVAADCWLYCTQQPGCFLGANLWGLCGTCGCGWVGSLGVQGVALVRTRVFVFAMYRMGLVAAPWHYWALCDGWVEQYGTGNFHWAEGFSLSLSRHWEFDQNNALRIFCTWV